MTVVLAKETALQINTHNSVGNNFVGMLLLQQNCRKGFEEMSTLL
jgi:hypothetical protein